MSDYFDSDNEELLKDFFMEAEQQVEKLEQNILAMESDSSDGDAIDEIFRAAHTLKGGAATVQMMEVAEFTHAVEDLLDGIRSNVCQVTGDIVDKLLQSLDVIKAMMEERQNGGVYSEDVSELKQQLRAFLGDKQPKSAKATKPAAAAPVQAAKPSAPAPSASSEPLPRLSKEDIEEMQALIEADQHVYRIRVEFDESNPMNSIGGIQVFAIMKRLGQVLRTVPDFDALYEDEFYPFVDYYLLTSESTDVLNEKSQVADVTLSVQITDSSELPTGPVAQVQPQAAEVVPVSDEPVAQQASDPGEAASPEAAPAENAAAPKAPAKAAAHHKKQEPQAQILRVDSRRIDSLLNLVSELVITKGGFNQALANLTSVFTSFQFVRTQFSSVIKEISAAVPGMISMAAKGQASVSDIRKELDSRFLRVFTSLESFEAEVKGANSKVKTITGDLGRITGELHEGVLKIRMVPVDQVFQRFPRLVRDLCKALNKNVKLDIIGGETEMDKTVTEELVDPLMHCVRNSMDHGIEVPEERIAAGKSPEGHLTLKASNQGNMVVIEIIDDGKGINAEAVRAKGIERGLISATKNLSDNEIFSLIMEPGFFTAKKITNISGRGVGLDVVKRSIEKLNGEISISSTFGQGTKFTIKLPLTLAIVQGLLVRVGRDVYAIPITSVLESFRVMKEELNILDGSEVFNVREDVVSIVRLGKVFGLESKENLHCHYLVLVGTEEKKVGLLVDELIGEEDVVIKPLKDHYTGTQGIAGATILGDGTVSLIIDVGQLLLLGAKQEIEGQKAASDEFIGTQNTPQMVEG